MDLFPFFKLTHENNEIKSPTKIYDFTVVNFSWWMDAPIPRALKSAIG